MAFWGIVVKPGKPITHYCEKARGRLRISQATLGIGEATKKSLVQCNVGNRSPILLCALLPNNTESCHLDLEFEEADDVVFSVIGPRSVYLTGYYVHQTQQSNTQSDTESYGVDIENSQTEGSSYNSDDSNYEDSFIDDGELLVSPPSPVLSGKVMDEAMLDNDMTKDQPDNCKPRKKKYQVVESDSDANSHESDDEDGFLLSVFKSKRAVKTTVSDDGEKSAQVTVQTGNKSEDSGICGSKSQQKVDPLDMNGEPEREVKLSLHNKGTKVKDKKNERLKEVETHGEIIVNKENALTDDKAHGIKTDANIINQNLPMNNGKDQMQSLDVVKPKKKRKERSKEEKVCEVGASTNLEMGGNCSSPPPELGSENGQKSKKRRKELQLGGICTQEIGVKCHNIPKDDEFEQDLLNADSITNNLPAANGEDQEQKIDNDVTKNSELLANDRKIEKKINKKKKKKTQGEGDLKIDMPNTTVNKEKTYMKNEDQIANTMPIHKRTLSNGLIVEDLSNGPSDGKVAAPGKKVKIYYTAMLKESGHIFYSNVGKTASKFLLGDEETIEGWNIGIYGMRVGDKRRLIIPPSMSYGKHGAGENIPPNSWLVYDVELVSVLR